MLMTPMPAIWTLHHHCKIALPPGPNAGHAHPAAGALLPRPAHHLPTRSLRTSENLSPGPHQVQQLR
ncbi:rCG45683, partial [Rattus norvegicus]